MIGASARPSRSGSTRQPSRQVARKTATGGTSLKQVISALVVGMAAAVALVTILVQADALMDVPTEPRQSLPLDPAAAPVPAAAAAAAANTPAAPALRSQQSAPAAKAKDTLLAPKADRSPAGPPSVGKQPSAAVDEGGEEEMVEVDTASMLGRSATWNSKDLSADGGGRCAGEKVHICFASDDPDLRPVVAAMNSTLSSTPCPGQLVFHMMTASAAAPETERQLRSVLHLRGATLMVHHDATLQQRIEDLVQYRKSSGARKTLSSPFNFAPFYLEDFLAGQGDVPQRLIYLDTDVILRSDVRELATLELNGNPAAAVKDCSQHFDIYIDFAEIKKLGFLREEVDPKACVFNRGIFVMDTRRWKQLRITKDIELWMNRYRTSEKDIYRFGMSQPPWLLALNGRYQPLSKDWNCRGLAREFLNPEEKSALKEELGESVKHINKALKLKSSGAYVKPFIATCATSAKLLHFNGALKPWKKESWKKDTKAPLCAQQGKQLSVGADAATLAASFESCADAWSVHIGPKVAKALDPSALKVEAAR